VSGLLYIRAIGREVLESLDNHSPGEEIIFPSQLRPSKTGYKSEEPGNINWRFRVPDGETISFHDGRCGKCSYTAGEDFGDFLVWRRDGFPSYELAVVVDDHEMQISEVVRGEDLLMSTARQILLYRALQIDIPDFYHCELLTDDLGNKLAKRHKSLSLRELINSGNIGKIKNTLKKTD
jgi:glutamyl-tRNA synthetase